MHYAFFVVLFCGVTAASEEKDSSENHDPDLDLTTPQIIRRHGYPSESHVVATEDGYLLTLHRIPFGRNNNVGNLRKPVFLHHGLMSSSSDFVLMGPQKALAYLLVDNGYDVWMGNCRGNYYSSGHISLSNDDPKYWDFSFHEIGVYDLPASIDYILQRVNQTSLYYVGHSMGTTIYFTMASSKPEYGLKVKAMFALAPVAYCSHMKSPIRILAHWANDFEFLAKYLGEGAFLPSNKMIKFLAKYGCEIAHWEKEICSNIMFIISGFDRPQFNMTLLPLILAHAPAGSSTKTVVHYAQEVNSGKFQQFDYGEKENLKRYGRPDPPEYDLTRIKTPVALYYGNNDWLASLVDVNRLYEELPRKIGKFSVNFPGFNHIDFIYGIDARTLVYDQIVKLLRTI